MKVVKSIRTLALMAFQSKVQWLEDTQLAEPFVLTDTVGQHLWRDRAAVELST